MLLLHTPILHFTRNAKQQNGDVTNLGGVVGAESGLGMHWPIILGPDVTNLGRVFEARNWLCIPSALILWTTYL